MQRIVSQTRVGENMIRHRTRIEDDPTIQGSTEAKLSLYRLMSTFVDVPDLLSCGLSPPQKISITHNGSAWVVEAEAVIQE